MGRVTHALHNLGPGDRIGLRGPLGNGFPVDELVGRDLLFIAGGIGLAPLRGLIDYVLDRRSDYGDHPLEDGDELTAVVQVGGG